MPKMDLGVGEMGFVFCGKHPFLMTGTQVGNPGPMDRLDLFIPIIRNCILSNCGKSEHIHLLFLSKPLLD